MELTAKEWLLLPQKEQEKRKGELSSRECFLLRTVYSYVHFSEEEKREMTEEKRNEFLRKPSEKKSYDF